MNLCLAHQGTKRSGLNLFHDVFGSIYLPVAFRRISATTSTKFFASNETSIDLAEEPHTLSPFQCRTCAVQSRRWPTEVAAARGRNSAAQLSAISCVVLSPLRRRQEPSLTLQVSCSAAMALTGALVATNCRPDAPHPASMKFAELDRVGCPPQRQQRTRSTVLGSAEM